MKQGKSFTRREKRYTRLTVRHVRESGLIGLWKDRDDIQDSAAYARRLRERAQNRVAQTGGRFTSGYIYARQPVSKTILLPGLAHKTNPLTLMLRQCYQFVNKGNNLVTNFY